MQNSKSNGNGMSWLYHLIWIIPVIGIILFHYEGGVGWFGSVFITLALVGTLFSAIAKGGMPNMGGGSSSSQNQRAPPPTLYDMSQVQQLNGGKKHGKKRK
jgi:hypothetical protein